MDSPILVSIFQQLLDSDVKTELALIHLLQQYNHYLQAVQNKRTPVSSSISRMLLYLSTIQTFHLQKIRIYQVLSHRDFQKCVSSRLLVQQERMKSQAEMTLEAMKRLTSDSSIRSDLDDLVHILSRKNSFLSSMLSVPAAPWISPEVKKGKQQAGYPKG